MSKQLKKMQAEAEKLILLFKAQKYGELEHSARRFVNNYPEQGFGCKVLAVSMVKRGNFADAIPFFQKAVSLTPFDPELYSNMAVALKELGRNSEAEAVLRKSLSIDSDNAATYNNLGNVLKADGRITEAINAYTSALQISPRFANAYNNLGIIHQDANEMEKAEAAFRKAIELDPHLAVAHHNLGMVLVDTGHADEGLVEYRKALVLRPDLVAPLIHIVMASLPVVVSSIEASLKVASDFAEALKELACLTDKAQMYALGRDTGTASPFNLTYRPGNHKELLSGYGDIISRACQFWFDSSRIALNSKHDRVNERKRLRLGIVSGHIRKHSVWFVLLKGLLQHIDKERFEIIVYHLANLQDEETDIARTLADRFEQGPKDWLSLITSDAPDILFYPEVLMDKTVPKLAALRLAPLQVATWGHPVTSGLPTIDIFFSGDLMESENACEHYREKLVRLPGTGACSVLMSHNVAPLDKSVIALPSDRKITRFLICQRVMKFEPADDSIYPEIALRTPNCLFYFIRDPKLKWASSIIEDRIKRAFVSTGLNPDQHITFVDWIAGDQFWSLLDECDIYLDTPSFSGFTTAWQAVHRGLPVITLEGEYLRQRLAAGLLRRIGVTDTIALDANEYVEKAVLLANDPVLRSELRGRLREASSFADKDIAVVRAFENALISATAHQ